MNSEQIINVVFNFSRNPQTNEMDYWPVALFGGQGLLAEDTVAGVYHEHWTDLSSEIRFKNLQELQKFILILCQKLNLRAALLLSNDEYNGLMDEVHDTSSFAKVFSKSGHMIVNEEYEKRQNLFSKFFK